MMELFQKTIRHKIHLKGVGLHTGRSTEVYICPAEPGFGIHFHRLDLHPDNKIPALWNFVVSTDYCTTIGLDANQYVCTVEHLMAAIAALEIDNLAIYVVGPEVPILDGSAKIFMDAFESAGIDEQPALKSYIIAKREFSYHKDHKKVDFIPSNVVSLHSTIDFKQPAIGRQWFETGPLSSEGFTSAISKARTFADIKEIEYLKTVGLAQGGSLDNAIVVDDTLILNPEGLRYSNEFVRHKILDCLGDMRLLGHSLLFEIRTERSGHTFHLEAIRAAVDNDIFEAVCFQPKARQTFKRQQLILKEKFSFPGLKQ